MNKEAKCMKCGSSRIEELQTNEYACKECRTHFQLSDISQEDMIEWFCD